MQCRRCSRHIGVEITGSGDGTNYKLIRIYPPRRAGADLAQASDAVRSALQEAIACTAVAAPNGAALMCRRAVQLIAREKGTAGGTLKSEIDSLPIPDELKTLAHSVRVVANDAAHPDPIQWDAVSSEDAEELIDVTLQMVHYLYELPARVNALRQKILTERGQAP